MKKLIAVFLAFIVLLTACGQQAPTWQEQYDLGVRYLSEGNYQEAIIAFTAAIEIDPKQDALYEQLANAYLEMGDYDQAIDTLEQGYEATGSSSLEELLTALRARYLTEDWIRAEEWTINGVPFWEASQEDVTAAYPFPGGESSWQQSSTSGFPMYSAPGAIFGWNIERDAIWYMDIHGDEGYIHTIQASRHITTESSFEETMNAIGITDEGIAYVMEVLPSREYNLSIEIATVTENDYILEVRAFRSETDSRREGELYHLDLRYDFFSGMRFSISLNFTTATSQLKMDYGNFNVRYET